MNIKVYNKEELNEFLRYSFASSSDTNGELMKEFNRVIIPDDKCVVLFDKDEVIGIMFFGKYTEFGNFYDGIHLLGMVYPCKINKKYRGNETIKYINMLQERVYLELRKENVLDCIGYVNIAGSDVLKNNYNYLENKGIKIVDIDDEKNKAKLLSRYVKVK